jgi:hypothetical protein
MQEVNYKEYLLRKLKQFGKDDIILTNHAKLQADFRGIDPEEVEKNILNPTRLAFAGKQKAQKKGEEKYDCYFGYSKTQAHRYILVLSKGKIIIPTVVKINRRWQHKVKKHAKV